jgi:hypothetical protein
MCIALHRSLATSERTKDCVRTAMEAGIPTCLIDPDDGTPGPLSAGHDRLV